MLRIFLIGVLGLISGFASADQIDEIDCLAALKNGEVPLRSVNIIDCLQSLQSAEQITFSNLETSLRTTISNGDDATLEATRQLLTEFDPTTANESLSNSFDQRSALAQIQAQASCTAISFSLQSFGRYIRAIARPHLTPSGRPASGNGDAITCNAICAGLNAPRQGRETGSCIAAVHIYGTHDPLTLSETDFTSVGSDQYFTRGASAGLMTHVYGPAGGCSHAHFGPNFCCCSN